MIELRRAGVFVLLFLGVGAGLHLLLDPLRDTHQPPLVKTMVLACGLTLCVLGVIGGVLLARLQKDQIDAVASHLEEMVQRRRIGLMIGDSRADAIGRLGRAVNRYLHFVKEEIEQSEMTAKEHQIRMKVLEAEKRHVEAVIHALSDAVIVTDAFSDLVLANEAAEAVFGFRFDAAVRRPVEELVRDEAILALLRDMRETGLHAPHRTAEWTDRREGGDPGRACGPGAAPRTYRVVLSAVLEGRKRERVSGVVAVLHDVTREKEIARMKSDFVSTVSHELKAPLASIKAYVEMLLDGEASGAEDWRQFLGTIAAEADRLSRFIENILNLSRLESGLVPVNKTDLGLAEILRDVADVMTPQAAQKNVLLAADLSPVFFRVHGDRDMLYQAVLNVVSNAVKYTPDGGKVRITTYQENGCVAVAVQDTGCGIAPEEIGKVFEKFYRARTRGQAAPGTGLGLSLVKHVIEKVHGGRIALESRLGEGTTMRLYLPAVR